MAQQKSAPADVEEVVVTGSSIRGAQPVGSNLITLGRDEITKIGAPNTQELLNRIPQLSTFNNLTRTTGNTTGGSGGSNVPQLRQGVPTLILLDGQRIVPDSPLQQPGADPTEFPPNAFERVEVVPDGASAVYGSDAIAGVINFITRKNLDGVELNVRQAWARGDYESIDISGGIGKVWASGSANLFVAYNENEYLLNRDADFYTNDLRSLGGVDARVTSCPTPNIVIGGVNYAPPSYLPGAAVRCDPLGLYDMIDARRRIGAIANFNQDITENLHFWAQLTHRARYMTQHNAPAAENLTIPATNPFFKAIPGVTASSEQIRWNSQPLYTGMFDEGIPTSYQNKKVTSVAGGFDYTLGRWNAGISYNRQHAIYWVPFTSNGINTTALQAAARGTTTATALDPFGNGTSQATLDAILSQFGYTKAVNELEDIKAKVDGPLMTLPGGEVKLAVGGGYIRSKYHAYQVSGPNVPSEVAVASDRGDANIFAELFVPIFSAENARPGFQELSLSAAVRRDHYSDFGDTTNPKYGITWAPIADLKLRASYGTSFRAPDLGNLNALDTRAQYSASSTLVPPGQPAGATVLLAGGNPNLRPETATTYSAGAEYAPSQLPGLRASLTYYNIEYLDRINIPPVTSALFTNPGYRIYWFDHPTPEFVEAYTQGMRVSGIADRPFPQVDYMTDNRRYNLGGLKTDGIDISIAYRWMLGSNDFTASFDANRIFHYDIQGATGNPYIPDDTVVREKARASLSWDNGPVSAGAALNYLGDAEFVYANASGASSVWASDPVTTVDLRGAYKFENKGLWSGVRIQVNIDNVFDTDPPPVPLAGNSGNNGQGAGYVLGLNPLGRTVWIGISKELGW